MTKTTESELRTVGDAATALPRAWTLREGDHQLPAEALKHLQKIYVLKDPKAYREALKQEWGKKALAQPREHGGITLFSMTLNEELKEAATVRYPELQAKDILVKRVLWATESYHEDYGEDEYGSKRPLHDLNIIRARVEKTQEEQKARVKKKAEVFTPAWVVNLQNNLVDEAFTDPKTPFNIEDQEARTWTPTATPLLFQKPHTWAKYVIDQRLELCCGEGPYLFSPYDASSGLPIPVRDEGDRFQRVGLLDRKLRVVFEHADPAVGEDPLAEWRFMAQTALKNTYGFEWQGDNLLLARLNMVNTYFDYMRDFCEHHGIPWPPEGIRKEAIAVAKIVSWQLWQMDGLKMVVPETCTPECLSCKKKLRTNHDGLLPVIPWRDSLRTFEAFYGDEAAKNAKNVQRTTKRR